jgi:hypothetical protein
MTTEDYALVAAAVFIAGALIGATAVVGVCGVLLARRLAMGGLWVVALLFVSIALLGAIAVPWLVPGWADALAALCALCAALPLWLVVWSRWPVDDEPSR